LPPYKPQFTTGKPYSCRSSTAGGTTFDQSVAGWETVSDGRRYPTSLLAFANETGLHPTQKPVDLLRYLVRTYTNEGNTVLDFTAGSGTTGVACALEGRNFIGIEREKEYVTIARKRIAEASQMEVAA
jgi:site-specific DNA-methyltransferase (adenine-specific)